MASAGVAIVGTDCEGIITVWNAAAERLFGYRPDEALGRHIAMLSLPDHQADEADAIARIQNDSVTLVEQVLLTKSQHPIEVSMAMRVASAAMAHYGLPARSPRPVPLISA